MLQILKRGMIVLCKVIIEVLRETMHPGERGRKGMQRECGENAMRGERSEPILHRRGRKSG